MLNGSGRVREFTGRASKVRNVVLLGTALGCSLAVPANAEKVIFNGSGDFTATRTDTLIDTAQVVDARTTTGNLLLSFSNLQAASATNGSALYASVSTAGTIGVTTGIVNVTGTNQTNGIYLQGTNGNITLVAGTTTANTNNADRAINVTTPIGNITITSTQADGAVRGISTSDGTGNALPNGVTTINSGTATANGTGQVNAIVAQGRTVNVTSGAASTTNAAGNQGAAIFAQAGDGGATIKSTTVSLAGLNQSGIQVGMSGNGAVNIDSGTVSATQSATGILVNAVGQSGATTLKSGTINLGANSLGIDVEAGTGANNIDSGTISSSGGFTTGILVNSGSGPTTIKSDNINLTGAGTTGITVANNAGTAGAVTINSNKINVVGNSAIAYALSGGDGGGAVAVNSTAITGSSYGGGAISINNNAGINIVSGSIAQTAVASGSGNSINGAGITAVSFGAQAMTINSGNIAFTGTGNTLGITAQATAGGDLNITSGNVSVVGNGGYGVLGYSTSGSLNISSTGDITTRGTTRAAGGSTALSNQRYADGLDAISTTGAITVSNAGTVSTAGVNSRGIDVEAGKAIVTFLQNDPTLNSTKSISVTNSGTVTTAGANAQAINVKADNNAVTLVSNVARTTGASSNGINVIFGSATTPGSGTGTLTLNSANVSTSGAGSAGINVQGGAGAINVTTGNVTTTGAGADAVHIVSASGPITATINGALSAANGTGLFIDPPSAVTVTVAAGGSASGSTNGLSVVGTANSITNLGMVATTGTGAAILASGTTSLDNSGTIRAGSGGVAVQLGATNDTVTLRTGSAVAGTIAGGGGTDRAVLAGAVGVSIPTQTIAGFTGFDSLNVASGYWTAGATPSAFNSATIASGAALEVANSGAGFSGVSVPSFTDNGTLVIRSTSGGTGSTLGATTVTGTGGVLFTGAGTATLDGTNSISATNAITVAGGSTLVLTGTQSGPIATQAGSTFQLGNGGTTGTFTGALADDGAFVYNRSDDYTLAGAVTGAGSIVKNGAGKLTFGTGYAFTGTTTINGGSIKLSTPVAATTELAVEGTGQLDLSGTRQTVAELAGTSTQASVNISGGSLAVNQATNTVFAGNLTGNGSFSKTGTGSLNFTGTSTYTGATTVDGGRLAVNGSIVSAVSVNSGGTLGGSGAIGGAAIAAGGTYAPGNSIGTQTVNGNVSFAAGSTYAVEANPDGRSDKIIATGTATIAGGTVAVLPEAGTFAKVTGYTILTAAGGVTGRFTNVTSNMAFLSPILDYTATAVNLTLARNDLSFGAIASNPNQLAVANGIAARGLGDPVFNAVLVQSVAGGQAAFSELSGELYASVPTVLIDEGRRVREAVLDRAGVSGDGIGVWATGLRSMAQSSSSTGIASTNTDRWGVVSGIDLGRNGIRIGAAAGFINSNTDMGARASHADIKTKLLSVYGGWTGDKLAVQAGGSYSWQDVDSRRTVATAGLAGTERASYDAHSEQLFADVSYKLFEDGAFNMSPFAGYAHVRTHSDRVTEGGTAAALTIAADTRDADFATFGLRMMGEAPISQKATFLPRLAVSYQLGRGDLDGTTAATFGDTGATFGVIGARIGRSTFNIDGGFDVAIGSLRIGAGAFASTANAFADQGGKVTLGLSF